MTEPTAEFREANHAITDAVRGLPDTLTHTQCAIGVLLARAQELAAHVPHELRIEWAECAYRIADALAAPEENGR